MKKILLLLLLIPFMVQAQVFTENFEADVIDSTTFLNWTNVDFDGDGEMWEVADIGSYAATNAPNHPIQSLAADSDSWEGTAFSPDNYLITANPIDLTFASGTSLTYTVGTYQTNGTYLDDKYSIYMCTSNDVANILLETPLTTRFVGDDCPSAAGDGSDSGAIITIDASAYDGQLVYLVFRHYDTTDMNSVLIDDIEVNIANVSVNDLKAHGFSYYPNPVNEVLNLKANTAIDQVEILNLLGQKVFVDTPNSLQKSVDFSDLQSGIYLVKVAIDGSEGTFKIVKK